MPPKIEFAIKRNPVTPYEPLSTKLMDFENPSHLSMDIILRLREAPEVKYSVDWMEYLIDSDTLRVYLTEVVDKK